MPKNNFFIFAAGILIIGFFAFGIIIGHFAIKSDAGSSSGSSSGLNSGLNSYEISPDLQVQEFFRQADPNIAEKLLNEFNAENIEANLKKLTKVVHRAGTKESLDVSDWIAQQHRKNGLDSVEQPEYQVLLSYPDNNEPNRVWLIDGDGNPHNVSLGQSEPLAPGDNNTFEARNLFNAYGANGDVKSKKLYYVNYGRIEDYDYLVNVKKINFTDSIVIARYGEIWRGAKGQFAQQLGAKGIILYVDPFDFSNNCTDYNCTYPYTIFMPPEGSQRGTATFGIANGDYPTPYLPAKDYAYRLSTEELQKELVFPKIPVTPISYKDAAKLLSQLSGEEAPPNWQGTAPRPNGWDGVYRLGGDLKDNQKIRLKVNNYLDQRPIRNVIAYIRGKTEPEKYVILGNHHDAWTYGAIDPNSGTAVLIEVARVFMAVMNSTGWRPRRTIVFCSWDAEEYGLVGSNEWIEDNMRRLEKRAIAYLNIDISVDGNLTLRANGAPLLRQVTYDAAKVVPNPSPSEVVAGRKFVYDTWNFYEPDKKTKEPRFSILGSGSDYTYFQDYIGIPSLDIRYTQPGSYPLYHTMYETPYMFSTLVDQNFFYSKAVGQIWAEVARNLADSLILPFDVLNYAKLLNESVLELVKNPASEIQAAKDHLLGKLKDFISSANALQNKIQDIQTSNDEAKIRTLNEKLQYLERMFIMPNGLPTSPQLRHVLFAPSSTDSYSGELFAAIYDSLAYSKPPKIKFVEVPDLHCNYSQNDWNQILQKQLSWASYCLDSAADWLRRDY